MFESGEGVGAVAVEFAMRAVVEAEDVAGAGAGRLSGDGQISLGMIGDGLHSGNQPFCWFLQPITGKQSPHEGAVAEFAGRGNDPGIAHTEGRAEPLRRGSQEMQDGIVAEAQLDANFSVRQAEKIGMSFRVVADEVSTSDGLFDQFGTFADVSAN